MSPDDDSKAIFVVLEGLSGAGKSTIAPLLAEALNAEFMNTLVEDFEPIRRKIDMSGNVMIRMHFWMMANYAISDTIQRKLALGCSVIIESYFFRTLATHGAMGARLLPEVDWSTAVYPDLAVLLYVNEDERQRRLRKRDGGQYRNKWHRLSADTVKATEEIYSSYNLTSLDVTGFSPSEIVAKIVKMTQGCAKKTPTDFPVAKSNCE